MVKLISFLLALIFNLHFASPALAHVLQSDSSVGAVLHIDPADDPIAGEASSFFFEFKDKKGKFESSKCNCIFSVLENGSEIYRQNLFQNSSDPNLNNPSVFYTFPNRGVYTIRVTGEPNQAGMFEPFTLTYDIRVERETSAQSPSNPAEESQNLLKRHMIHFIPAAIILAFIIVSLSKRKGGGIQTQNAKIKDKK